MFIFQSLPVSQHPPCLFTQKGNIADKLVVIINLTFLNQDDSKIKFVIFEPLFFLYFIYSTQKLKIILRESFKRQILCFTILKLSTIFTFGIPRKNSICQFWDENSRKSRTYGSANSSKNNHSNLPPQTKKSISHLEKIISYF